MNLHARSELAIAAPVDLPDVINKGIVMHSLDLLGGCRQQGDRGDPDGNSAEQLPCSNNFPDKNCICMCFSLTAKKNCALGSTSCSRSTCEDQQPRKRPRLHIPITAIDLGLLPLFLFGARCVIRRLRGRGGEPEFTKL